MRALARTYELLLYGMALAAGVLMVAMMVSIVTDVALRNLGTQSSAHLFTFNEYALLLVPLLGSPWLVREKGHVFIELVLHHMPPAAQRVQMRLITITCIVVCLVLAWYGGEVTVKDYVQSEKDVRSLDMPRWMLMAFMPLCFGMMAVEFGRFLARGESVYGAIAGERSRGARD